MRNHNANHIQFQYYVGKMVIFSQILFLHSSVIYNIYIHTYIYYFESKLHFEDKNVPIIKSNSICRNKAISMNITKLKFIVYIQCLTYT
jgi:hypothetical protein